jgi:DNA ligase 1
MLFATVAQVSDAVAATSARTEKVALLAAALRGLTPDEAEVVVSWLSGALPQRQIGVGWASLRALPAPAVNPSLSVTQVDETLSAIGLSAGPGSQQRRRQLLAELFAAATAAEQDFLRRLLSGDLRQGALAGVMTDAVGKAAGVPLADVRRAAMLRGDLAAVARAAISGGSTALLGFALHVGRPISPMLAQTASSAEEALLRLGGRAYVEWKLDGARIQVHRAGDDVRIFTRTLDDITIRVPEIIETVRTLPVQSLVADGEAIALRSDRRPHPFQVTASRIGSRVDPNVERTKTPLSAFLFDVLHVDGTDVIDLTAKERHAALEKIVPIEYRVPYRVVDSAAAAATFLEDALAHGHEGVMVKSLDAPYEAGRRGASWLKVKPVHTLDLVVLAVEWGSGRRRGRLSNIHLGARDPDTGEFIMLGKTFKGMTDEMLDWQTRRFSELASGPLDSWVVPLRPEQVVEIAFDGVQTSTRYPGGVALRFARVVRYRDDKTAAEADTIATVRAFRGE